MPNIALTLGWMGVIVGLVGLWITIGMETVDKWFYSPSNLGKKKQNKE